jgi:hypothetical protein
VFNNVNGTQRFDVFDAAGNQSWTAITTACDANGAVTSQTWFNDDGSKWLVANDTANTAGWSSFAMIFDANWNYVGINVTNDDGTHTPDMAQIWNSFDTMTWYASTDWHIA